MKQPTRFQEISFFIKSRYFIGKRFLKNVGENRSYRQTQEMIGPHQIANSVSQLRISQDPAHHELQEGKIHNLKIACESLHGLRISKNEEFSFWKILGRPTTKKGYTIGREIRYGCVIPTVAGGLCQLSGALYEAATLARFEITERHAHTATGEGMDIPPSRDCTIFWNYVDFKFKPHVNVSLSAIVTQDQLIVTFFSDENCLKIEKRQQESSGIQKKHIESCETCHEFECHQKQKLQKSKTILFSTGLDRQELEYFGAQEKPYELIWIPSRLTDLFQFFNSAEKKNIRRFERTLSFKLWIILCRARWKYRNQKTVAEKSFSIWKDNALLLESVFAESKKQKIETEFILDQRLLPWLWDQGILIDRKYSVLFRHLPIIKMQERLDLLAAEFPTDQTLIDFRAPLRVAEAEWKSLKSAQRLYSSHDELITLMDRVESIHRSTEKSLIEKDRVEKTEISKPTTWKMILQSDRPYLLFPGPSLSREGRAAVLRLLKGTSFTLCLLDSDRSNLDFWKEIPTKVISKTHIPWNQIAGVIHPTIFEGKNDLHLEAISRGIPVIGTKGLGLHLRYPICLMDDAHILSSAKDHPKPFALFDTLHGPKS